MRISRAAICLFGHVATLAGCAGGDDSDAGGFATGLTGATAGATAGTTTTGISGSDTQSPTDGSGSAGETTGAAPTTTATSADDSDSSPATGDASASTLPGPDLPDISEACTKVDVLLVVDASATMADALASLPSTFAEIQATLALAVGDGIDDFHVAVINACPKPPHFHNYGAGDTDCEFPDGRNWLAADDPTLAQSFACVVQLPFQDEALEGKGGDNGGYESIPDTCSDEDDEDEQPAWTAAKALDPGVAVNAGFARADAVLFVVAITDEDESLVGPDDAGEIHDAIVAAKGDAARVVFLGIGGDEGGCDNAYGGGEVKDSKVLREVAETFGARGMYRTMCESRGDDPIGAAFDEALTTVVDAACDGFIPD
ncbi:hypothetical protein SAMN02745121_09136 [Nannocystis exedens]|uniref:VWFA domain-containing protein n=1 Tax=Nannocystis exedens TaxID=54 RepID=A0A1I2J6L9_9BACT|nr:hypothetical protein [Nannocystis exedens]PCC74714.1 hypothetical protein NAEX_07811 [Nannocystis exedens]SFF48341.1 hypothetical protein SAMN02745121_09136 [Nannocystis exedens]